MPGADGAADVLPLIADHVEGRRGAAEVHDDRRSAVVGGRGERVEDPVRAHLARVVGEHGDAGPHTRARPRRPGSSAKCRGSMSRHSCRTAGTVAADRDPVDGVDRLAEQAAQQHRPLVGRRRSSVEIRQVRLDLAVLEQPEDGVAVADVGGQERHRPAITRSRPTSKTVTEWVRAPTEMRSTPVSATSRARSSGEPTGCLERWPGPRPDPGATASAIVASRMLSSRISLQPTSRSSRSWSRSVTSTSTRRSG